MVAADYAASTRDANPGGSWWFRVHRIARWLLAMQERRADRSGLALSVMPKGTLSPFLSLLIAAYLVVRWARA